MVFGSNPLVEEEDGVESDLSDVYQFPERTKTDLRYDDFNRRLFVCSIPTTAAPPVKRIFPWRVSHDPARLIITPDDLMGVIRRQFRPAYSVIVDPFGHFATASATLQLHPAHSDPYVEAILGIADETKRPVIFSFTNAQKAMKPHFILMRYRYSDMALRPAFLGDDVEAGLEVAIEALTGDARNWMYFSHAQLRHKMRLLDQETAEVNRALSQQIAARADDNRRDAFYGPVQELPAADRSPGGRGRLSPCRGAGSCRGRSHGGVPIMIAGTLLTRGMARKVTIWREYWHKDTGWNEERLAKLASCKLARKEFKEHRRALARPPLLHDYPRGLHPFLGVMTMDEVGHRSPDAGVLEFPLKGHLLTIAPTRTGKGTCQIIPNLLTYAGSTFVIDIKGENADITERRRKTIFPGAAAHRFAPLADGSACYNPLDFVRINPEKTGSGPDTYADCRLLADMLLPEKGRDSYWDLEARNLLTLLLMYVAVSEPRGAGLRTMRRVVQLLFPDKEKSRFDLAEDDGPLMKNFLRSLVVYGTENEEPILRSLAWNFLEQEERLFLNVVASARSGMHVWLSPRLLTATDRSDFQFSELKRSMCRPHDPAPTTIYVVVPPEQLHEYRGVVRMMTGLAVAELIRDQDWGDQPGWSARPPADVLFLLDELPALGYMQPIVQGVAYLAGYGVQVWSFVQSVGQMKKIYGEEWQNFTANAGATCIFGVNDGETAKLVEDLLGQTNEYEVYYETESSTSGSSHSMGAGFGSMSQSSSDSQTWNSNVRVTRELVLDAAAVRAMDPDLQFVFIRNTPPIVATKMPYYDFPLFWDLYGTWKGGGRA